jgi:hypothetical protein
MLIILASLVGILIGLNFRASMLIPACLIGAAAYTTLSIEHGFGANAVAILVAAVAVQGGYMIGLTGRDMFAQILTRLNIVQSKRV